MSLDREAPLASTAQADGSGTDKKVSAAVRSEWWLLALAVLLAAALVFWKPDLAGGAQRDALLNDAAQLGFVALGMTVVVLTGGLDLAAGALVGLAGAVFASMVGAFPVPLAGLAAIAVGMLAGAVSGCLIAVFRLPSAVVTLGIASLAQSAALAFGHHLGSGGAPNQLTTMMSRGAFGLPFGLVWLGACSVLAWAYLTFAKGGRTLLAIGSNREAAKAAGLNTLFFTALPFVLSGALASLAAVWGSADTLPAEPQSGFGLTLAALAAVLIGGARLSGGRVSVGGTLIGVAIVAMARAASAEAGLPTVWQGGIIGALLIAAMLVHRLARWHAHR